MAYILAFLIITSPIQWDSIRVKTPNFQAITSENVIHTTNEIRIKNGLSPLKENTTLDDIASYKVTNMSVFHSFSHIDSTGEKTSDEAALMGYPFTYFGENLAVYFSKVDAMQASFMASSEHRENILNPHYKDIGIGIAKGTYEGVETIYVAVEFGAQ